MDNIAIFWLVFGVILMLLELLLPGLVVVFLGTAAILVSLAMSLGFIEEILSSVTAWFISSIVLTLGFRGLVMKFIPAGDVSFGEPDNLIDSYGKIVTVVEEIGLEEGGRILYQDSTWPAITEGEHIPIGAKAKILTRINVTFVVEPVFDLADKDLLED
ncbi:MAG: NfeD family protein [Deltaproteobacteria bacterium]|nr:NfeD family protein [Deltaproteobacteria bacterium]